MEDETLFRPILESGQLVWQRFWGMDEKFPSDAVLVDGRENDSSEMKKMYIGLVDLQKFDSHGPYGDKVPGYVQRDDQGITTICYANEGKAIKSTSNSYSLQILTNPAGLKLTWLPNFEGQVPSTAISHTFIDDESLRTVYIGRTINSKIIGQVHPEQKCLFYPNFEKNLQEKIGAYEVLSIDQR
jgi:hypothetical protein